MSMVKVRDLKVGDVITGVGKVVRLGPIWGLPSLPAEQWREVQCGPTGYSARALTANDEIEINDD